MSTFLQEWITRTSQRGVVRDQGAVVDGWGCRRELVAFDFPPHTLIVEPALLEKVEHRAPIIIVGKAVFDAGASGFVFTLSGGNHSVVAIPLLRGCLWDFGPVAEKMRSQVLRRRLVYANAVGGGIEISQRETPTELVVETDRWLQEEGWSLDKIILADRVDSSLQHYHELGQEWRIKPLAWTREEMVAAIEASLKRLHSELRYHHNVKGVHLLTQPRFASLSQLGERDFPSFVACLDELAGLAGDSACSLLQKKKFHGHHEIELFGIRPGVAEQRLLPQIEKLLCGIRGGQLPPQAALRMKREIDEFFADSLIDPALADEQSDIFVRTMYKHLTGAIYQGDPDEVIPAFDDRRAALPGATYAGRQRQRILHPGVDNRTLAILDYIESVTGHGERVEYVNVYEIRGGGGLPLGQGQTREMVYKTNRSPLPRRRIEKRLAHRSTGYGNYTLARVEAFSALGVSYGPHHLLARHDGRSGEVHYYVRERYPGDPFTEIPRSRFLGPAAERGNRSARKDRDAILTLCQLMGQAAAENMVLKKYRFEVNPNRYGIGKEIIEFGYDLQKRREMPLRARLCSIRGTLGWPNIERTEKNLSAVFDFYMDSFAEVVVKNFIQPHRDVLGLEQLRDVFFEGFASKTREIFWNYNRRREVFDGFNPELDDRHDFISQWRFALWSLRKQKERLPRLRDLFASRLALRARCETGNAE